MSDMIKAGEYAELEQVARALSGSKYCNENTAADALWIIATGRSLGLDPVTSLRGIHVIKGKPVLSADLMAGAAMRHPDCIRFQVKRMDAEGASVEVMRKGWEEPSTFTFTLEDAKAAGITGNPTWRKYPADMCKARAISRAARAAFPDAILGTYVEGELDEVREEPKKQERQHAEVIDVEIVEPRVWSEDKEWRQLNKVIRGTLTGAGLGKADADKWLEYVKGAFGVESLTHLSPARMTKIQEKLQGLGTNEKIVAEVKFKITPAEVVDAPEVSS